jgi:hypothetical protein
MLDEGEQYQNPIFSTVFKIILHHAGRNVQPEDEDADNERDVNPTALPGGTENTPISIQNESKMP